MIILSIICLGSLGLIIGRIAFHKWFNHITFYSLIWSASLILFHWKLIDYYPIEFETWLVIIASWLFFVLGSLTISFARSSNTNKNPTQINDFFWGEEEKLTRLNRILWVLNILSLVAAIYNLYIVSIKFGGIWNTFTLGNFLYSYRVSRGLPGGIPYVSSLVFTSALLAGNYTARIGKMTLVSVLPLLIIVIIDFTNMGRASILVASILFASAYFLTYKEIRKKNRDKRSKLRQFGFAFIVIVIVISGADFIRTTRQAKETFVGSTKTLEKLSEAKVITPSIYLYLTAHFGVLNKYMKAEGENTPIGGHTFLTLYRILESLGLDVHSNTYQIWYRTPVRVNVGTYLRELHGDFGIPGLLLGPYLLGLLTSFFWYRFNEERRYLDLALLGFFYTIIGMSIFVLITRLSPFFFYSIVSILVCLYLDKKEYWKQTKKVYAS